MGKVTVQHRFELGQHVEKWLFECLVLRRDGDFIFPVFAELFYCITLDEGKFPDVRLSVDCCFIMEVARRACWLSVVASFASCASLRVVVISVALQGVGYSLLNAVGSIL